MSKLADLLRTDYRRQIAQLVSDLADAQSKIKILEAKLETDPLLNIANQLGFDRELKRALSYTRRYHASVAIYLIELDQFKSINDGYGNLAGDAVLRTISTALVRHHRASDIVARYGSDKFALLLWNLKESDALNKLQSHEHLISSLRIEFSEKILSVTASVGSTMLRRFDCLQSAMARADADMEARKRARCSEVKARSGFIEAVQDQAVA